MYRVSAENGSASSKDIVNDGLGVEAVVRSRMQGEGTRHGGLGEERLRHELSGYMAIYRCISMES